MIIVHPNDRTTNFLKLLYPPSNSSPDVTENTGPKEVNRILNEHREFLILGHGSQEGLYCDRTGEDEFGRILIGGKKHGYYLRQSRKIIGIWCNAIDFARAQGLHGLFSGMIISEEHEAREYGIPGGDLESENLEFALRLGELLWDPEVLLSDIPKLMKEKAKTEIQKFNYGNLWYL